MLVDLVQTNSRDGLRLDGAWQTPPASAAATVPLDAFCLVHGTGGNFYSSTLLNGFAERLLELGSAVLRVNTRGHDGISTAASSRGGVRLGAAYEMVDDCRHDLAAWLAWLRDRTGPRIGLLGHSLGAVKCLYALAQEPQLGAACVVALSPPCLSYARFCSGPQVQEFLGTYRRAEQLVAAGEAGTLLEVQRPLPLVITAAGFVEKYGPEERYNYLNFLAGVPCPTLVLFGGLEVAAHMAFQGAPDAVADLAARHSHLHTRTVAAADHFYSASRGEALAAVETWLRAALSP